jgi:hypothetical protein
MVGPDGFTLSTSKEFLKITTNDCGHHTKVLGYLTESDHSFHTYAPRHTRPVVAIIRHLHHSTPAVDIDTVLTDLGFSVLGVESILNRTDKRPLSLFAVHLTKNEFNMDVFKLTKLLNSKVIIESQRKKSPPATM